MKQTRPQKKLVFYREDNPIVYVDVHASGGFTDHMTRKTTEPRSLGRIYIELRQDIVPITCSNFLALISGSRGIATDGIPYCYKGTKLHRVCKDVLIQGGDLLGMHGNCSKSIFNNGGVFNDENFLLRHTGVGVLSMSNLGPNTNGSIFQISMIENPMLDERYVVFGFAVGDDSLQTLQAINRCGSIWGQPLEELTISDCGVAFPKPFRKEKLAAR